MHSSRLHEDRHRAMGEADEKAEERGDVYLPVLSKSRRTSRHPDVSRAACVAGAQGGDKDQSLADAGETEGLGFSSSGEGQGARKHAEEDTPYCVMAQDSVPSQQQATRGPLLCLLPTHQVSFRTACKKNPSSRVGHEGDGEGSPMKRGDSIWVSRPGGVAVNQAAAPRDTARMEVNSVVTSKGRGC